MKYKLINRQTGEEHLCDKVTMDRFDYYVGNIPAVSGDFALYAGHIAKKLIDTEWTTGDKKVIATTNSNINAPQVVNEVEQLAKEYCEYWEFNGTLGSGSNGLAHDSFISGYNKSQETHPFSAEDMIEFVEWIRTNEWIQDDSKTVWAKWLQNTEYSFKTTKQLFQSWKEQQPKVIYYNTIKQ